MHDPDFPCLPAAPARGVDMARPCWLQVRTQPRGRRTTRQVGPGHQEGDGLDLPLLLRETKETLVSAMVLMSVCHRVLWLGVPSEFGEGQPPRGVF